MVMAFLLKKKMENGKYLIFQTSVLHVSDYGYLSQNFDTNEELMGEIRKMIEYLGNRIID